MLAGITGIIDTEDSRIWEGWVGDTGNMVLIDLDFTEHVIFAESTGCSGQYFAIGARRDRT